ncbi:MAG TPA: YkgJ family cysteine cluster protein [Pyrinomonadaceae bacterium]|nr:YkgJ family cysteine cluster protein [Pyrinomonadaceae bacterium]
MKEITEWITGNVTLTVNGQPLELQMTVPATPVKPQRMLPIFQRMTDSFVEMGASAAQARGQNVSCRAGCGACCRQMVPVAEIETHRLAEVVAAMPEPQRSEVYERFDRALAELAETDIFERMSEWEGLKPDDRERIVREYFKLNIPCPFLEDESCSIHQERPVSCREYLVTSPAEHCAELSPEKIRRIEIPVKPSTPLRHLGQTNRVVGADFIPLVLALRWVEKNPDRFHEKSGEEWMADFFRILTNKTVPIPPKLP